MIVVGAGPGVADALGELGGGASIPLDEGRDVRLRRPAVRRAHPRGRLHDRSTPHGGCFDGKAGAIVTEPADGLLLFGADEALTNDQILRADNAAVALRLLGQDDRLVWYVPSIDDLVGDDGVQPPDPAAALGAARRWRSARDRHGRRWSSGGPAGSAPLATEPLPVVVRPSRPRAAAAGSTAASGDRDHAAESLRRAARSRLAERLRLGSTTRPDVLVRDVARRTGRTENDVVGRCSARPAPSPSTDRDLITLARQLAELDREVRRT